jgi:hypothetical protein
MKSLAKILILSGVVSLSALGAKAQSIGIHIQLNRPAAYERNEREHPNRPSARHQWVAEEWTWSGNTYVYKPGYWALPPRDGQTWIPGHWEKREHRAGYFWHPGHWN